MPIAAVAHSGGGAARVSERGRAAAACLMMRIALEGLADLVDVDELNSARRTTRPSSTRRTTPAIAEPDASGPASSRMPCSSAPAPRATTSHVSELADRVRSSATSSKEGACWWFSHRQAW